MDGPGFIFQIPQSIDELTASPPDDPDEAEAYDRQYHVEQVYSPNQIESYLGEAHNNLRRDGKFFILKEFDLFYSVIKHFSSLSPQLRDKAWSVLLKAINRFQPELSAFLEPAAFNVSQRQDYQNTLLMLMYLFLTMSDFFEDVESQGSRDDFNGGGRGKKNKTASKSKEYQGFKGQAVKSISVLFSLRLERLFESPAQLTHLVNIITKYAYKLLENGNMIRGSTQHPIFTDICFIIGTALDRYDHRPTYCMRLIELLQGKESMIPIVSTLASNHIKNSNIDIVDILLQIKALDLNTLSKDNSATKALGSFLVVVAENCPQKMYQNLSTLVEFLEQDPYTLRNAVLEIICIIILRMFTLPTKNRDIEVKRKLLDILFEHIHDANSYTRSKVLQLWARLAKEGAIPMAMLIDITKRIIGRLEDKSCFVRKNAVYFLTESVKDNPFTILRNKDLESFKRIYSKSYERDRDRLEAIKDRQFKRLEEVLKLSGNETQANRSAGEDEDTEDEDDESNQSTESNKENEGERPGTSTGSQSRPNKRASGEPVVEGIATKRQKLMADIQSIAVEWINLEEAFLKFWERTGKRLDLTESTPEDIPQENAKEAFTFFRNLVKKGEFEKALRVLVSLKSMYPTEPVFQRRATNESENGSDELDEDNDDDEEGGFTGAFNPDDHLFLSAITNFSTDFSNKLPKLLDLARLVFLAPLLEFGNEVVEVDEQGGNNKKDDCLKNFLQQHCDELQSDQASIEQLEQFLVSTSQILFRIGQAQIFLGMLSEAVPKICQLLQSKNVADVQEAITFFKFAYKLELPKAIVGVQRMLKLIFTKEKTIKDKLMETFTEIYLNESESMAPEEQPEMTDDEDEEQMPNLKRIALLEIRNLSHMVLHLNQGELMCAGALIQEIYNNNKFSQMHLQVLWERYAMKLSHTSEEDSRAALIIIGMLASAQPNLVQSENNLASLIKVSLEDRSHDYRLVANTCDVLIRAFKLPSTESCDHFLKWDNDHLLFQRLRHIITSSITNKENPYWNLMSSAIIKVIYFYAQKPDSIISSILADTHQKLVRVARENEAANWNALCSQKTASDADPSTQQSTVSREVPLSQASTASRRPVLMLDDILLGRFLSMLGDVAMNLLIHLDLHLMREIQIRQHIEDKEKEQKKDSLMAKQKKKSDRRKTGAVGSLSTTISNITVDGIDDEMDEIGPNANEDPFQERITTICNDKILYGEGFLAKFKDTIEEIASDCAGQKFSLFVRGAASLALAKFMVLSLRFTREKRSVLASLLSSKDWEIRSNAVIAFGDLLVRFPNEFEHYTGKIFGCLNDSFFMVRSNALKVLTRLILADMIKPKGHISMIARLVVDADEAISGTARLFFVELAKKNNTTIYNFLPDIISNLSGDAMAEEKFQEMIEFLFELLEKARNTESLVTKLCRRFRESHVERHLRDLAFCLAALPFNDRAIANLKNNMEHFINAVTYDEVYDHFMNILGNARKAGCTLKPETKLVMEEMEEKIKECRARGIEERKDVNAAATAADASSDADEEGNEAGAEAGDATADSEDSPPPPPVERRGRSARRARAEAAAAAAPSTRSRRHH